MFSISNTDRTASAKVVFIRQFANKKYVMLLIVRYLYRIVMGFSQFRKKVV